MSYREESSAVASILNDLEVQVLSDMTEGEGVNWWTGLSVAQNLLLADYTIGLTRSTSKNLALAAMHKARRSVLQEKVDTRERFRLQRMAQAMGSARTPETDDLALEADGHMAGFFSAVVSTLDSLGAMVSATTGMGPNVVRTTWPKMLSWNGEKETSSRKSSLSKAHISLIDATVDRIESAIADGPRDWIEWSIDYRNTIVHRAHRINLGILDAKEYRISHPLPKSPAQTQGEALAWGRRFKDDIDGREAKETIQMIYDALLDLSSEVTRACITAWDTRRTSPGMHREQPGLWPSLLQGRESHFEGAGKTSTLRAGAVMAMNNSDASRVQKTRQLDVDLPQWRAWAKSDPSLQKAEVGPSPRRQRKQPKRLTRRGRKSR